MALVPQAISPTPRVRSFAHRFPEPQRFQTNEPFGQIIYSQADAVTAIGAGDSATLSWSFLSDSFLEGYCYKLRSIHAQVDEDSGGVKDWFGNVYQSGFKSTPEETATAMYWPIMTGLGGERDLVDEYSTNTYTIGLQGVFNNSDKASRDSVYSPLLDPRDFLIFPEGNQVQFQLGNNTPSCGPWVARIYAVFDQFNIEQANNSSLFWSVDVT